MTSVANKNVLGPLLIIIGLVFLFGSLDSLGIWRVLGKIWPLIFIIVGFLIISGHIPLSGWALRPGLSGQSDGTLGLFGDIRVSGLADDIGDIERSLLIGDIVIDLTNSNMVEGECRIKVSVIIGDITVIVPSQTPMEIALSCYLGSLTSRHKTAEGAFQQLNFRSDDFAEASARLHFRGKAYFGNIQVKESAVKRSSDG